MLLTGDLSHRVVDELATIVDNIFAPLLCKPDNHKELPAVAVQDISRHVHSLRGTLYQVRRISTLCADDLKCIHAPRVRIIST